MDGEPEAYEDPRGGMRGDCWFADGAFGCVVIGGSDGGSVVAQAVATALADAGVSALAVAYHGADGLRSSLRAVPLEGFVDAGRWLAASAGLATHQVGVLGLSRGSEAAMLVGARFDDVGRRVVGVVPGNVIAGSWPPTDPPGPAWLLDGAPLPCVHRPGPSCADPAAVIPVEQIDELLLVSAGRDEVWPSGPMSEAIVQRRSAHGRPTEHVHLPLAGHRVLDLPTPGAIEPGSPWQAIVHFLGR